MSYSDINYILKIGIKTDETFFGQGIAQLLLLVKQTNSLNEAAKIMGISYSKTWRIIKKAEEKIGFQFLTRKIGGANGGGSVVTNQGLEFLDQYIKFCEELQQLSGPLFDKYFLNLKNK